MHFGIQLQFFPTFSTTIMPSHHFSKPKKDIFISFFSSYLVFEIQCLHNLWLHLAVAAVQNLPLFGLRMKSYSYNMAGQPYYQIGSSRSSCFDFLTSSLRFSTMTSKLNRVDSTNQKCFAKTHKSQQLLSFHLPKSESD